MTGVLVVYSWVGILAIGIPVSDSNFVMRNNSCSLSYSIFITDGDQLYTGDTDIDDLALYDAA